MRIRTLLTSAATALLVALGLVVVAAPANAASTATITSAPGPHFTIGCWDHPLTATATLDPGVVEWSIWLKFYAPDGSYAWGDDASGYITPNGSPQTVTTALEAYLCSSDAPGTYTVTGVLRTKASNATYFPDVPVSGTFTTVLPAQPPLPPTPTPIPTPTTPPAPTYVTPTTRVRAQVDGRAIRLVLITGRIPTGTYAKVTTWRVLVDGERVFTKRVRANHEDTWSKRFKAHTGTHRIVVTKNNWHFRTYKVNTGR